MKVNTYRILSECIERGTQAGVRKAYKYVEEPDESCIAQQVEEYIMLEIAEYFTFEAEVNE